jgi:hypothetical protein
MLDEGDTKEEILYSHIIGLMNHKNTMLGNICMRHPSKIENFSFFQD